MDNGILLPPEAAAAFEWTRHLPIVYGDTFKIGPHSLSVVLDPYMPDNAFRLERRYFRATVRARTWPEYLRKE